METNNRPQNRHLRPNPKALGITPLPEDEASSKPIRIRGKRNQVAWLEGLNADQKARGLTVMFNAKQDIESK
jgi:hypothetical protein